MRGLVVEHRKEDSNGNEGKVPIRQEGHKHECSHSHKYQSDELEVRRSACGTT